MTTTNAEHHDGIVAAPAAKPSRRRRSTVPSLDRVGPTAGSPRGSGAVDAILAARPGDRLVDVVVATIDPHPDNPRSELGDLSEMVASIQSIGVLEPLILATSVAFRAARGETDPVDDGRYVTIAGHRRAAAAEKAGLFTVPAILRDDLAGEQGVTAMLVENLHREGLRPLEEARGYRKLADLGHTQTEIAELVGCTQANVSKKLALLELPAEVQQEVGVKNGVSIEDAAQLAKYATEPDVIKAAQARPSWQTIDQAAEKVRRERARASKVEAKKDEYRARGITRFVGWPAYGMTSSLERRMQPHATGPMKVSDLKASGVDVREHAKLKCHAIAIGYEGGWSEALKTAVVCIKPQDHGEAFVKKQETAETRAQREAEKARERAATRVEMARAILAGKPTRELTGVAETLMLGRLLRGINRDHEVNPLAVMLGVAPVGDGRRGFEVLDEITALAEKSPAGRSRVLAALALAHAEASIDAPYGRDDWAAGHYLRWMQSQGHELAGDERRLAQDKS